MLTLTWLVPGLGGVAVALLAAVGLGRQTKLLAAAVTAVTLGLCAYLAFSFDAGSHAYQFTEKVGWISGGSVPFQVDYYLGVDGISIWLIVLNALIGLVAVLTTSPKQNRGGYFLALLLLMQAGMAGVFISLDLVLFYFFWEAMLIPAYFLVWQWGEGERTGQVAIKFVLYTLVGSLLMLAGIIAEYALTGAGTFNLPDLVQFAHSSAGPAPWLQFWLFALFAAGFLVKIPVFPFHSWLPDTYVAAPTPMLLGLAGVMGKTGAYALLRILLPLFPSPSYWWNWNDVIPVLAVGAIIWGAFLALAQTDVKSLIAYSSLSHMGFIVLGVFSLNAQGQEGAVLQMVNHGLIVPSLFLIAAWLETRVGSRDRSLVAGLAPRMPVMAGIFMVVTLAALGLPGLNSFVGEFMTLLGAWQLAPWLAVAGGVGLVLAPVYMLRLYQGLMYGPEARVPGGSGGDLGAAELILIAPLVMLMFVLGLDPAILTHHIAAVGQPVPW